MSLLNFENVTFTNDNKNILKNVSIVINPKDFISIIGPSGGGKSTFLKLCCNLLSPTEGNIIYKDKSLMDYSPINLRRNIAYCFQTPYLFGNTVMENMEFPFVIRDSKLDMDRLKELFTMMNLSIDYLNREIQNLSGGEKQRIALIRTLLFKPEILLLDEVTSALDIDNKGTIDDGIRVLNDNGLTILSVTHDIEESKKNANKILTIENGSIKSLEVLR